MICNSWGGLNITLTKADVASLYRKEIVRCTSTGHRETPVAVLFGKDDEPLEAMLMRELAGEKLDLSRRGKVDFDTQWNEGFAIAISRATLQQYIDGRMEMLATRGVDYGVYVDRISFVLGYDLLRKP